MKGFLTLHPLIRIYFVKDIALKRTLMIFLWFLDSLLNLDMSAILSGYYENVINYIILIRIIPLFTLP
jgi:hypothetical protein